MKKYVLITVALLFVGSSVYSKEIPKFMEILVFENEKFSSPIAYQFEEDKLEYFEKDEKNIQNALYLHSNYAYEKYTGSNKLVLDFDPNRYNGVLYYLLSNKFAYVRNANVRVSSNLSRVARNASIRKVPFLFFNENFKKHQGMEKCEIRNVTNGYCLNMAKRKLLYIDFTNEYKGSPQGVELTFYAITFTYKLDGHLPNMDELPNTFKGKAKAYQSPDDGEWKLVQLELSDGGSNEYWKQLNNKFKNMKASELVQKMVSSQPSVNKTESSSKVRNGATLKKNTSRSQPAEKQQNPNSPSNKQKQDMAVMIIQDTLEEGRTGEKKAVYWHDDLLFEVTPTRSYRNNNQRCREYRVVSYETGKPVTINNAGNACRAKNNDAPEKWWPRDMGKGPMSGREIKAKLIGVDYSGESPESKESNKISKTKRKQQSNKSVAVKDPKNTIALDKKPTSLEAKKEKALQLVAYTLEKGRMGVEKSLSYDGKLICGVTMTKSFSYQNKYSCKEYKVISYVSGGPVTKLNPGKVCKVEGKYYPYLMISNPTMQSMSGDKFSEAMIGKW